MKFETTSDLRCWYICPIHTLHIGANLFHGLTLGQLGPYRCSSQGKKTIYKTHKYHN